MKSTSLNFAYRAFKRLYGDARQIHRETDEGRRTDQRNMEDNEACNVSTMGSAMDLSFNSDWLISNTAAHLLGTTVTTMAFTSNFLKTQSDKG